MKALFAIVILASFLRLYGLGSFPPSIYWDEAAIGYNAYSIAQTGRDEYGIKYPILFKSFNDFKLPGYIYLDSIFVKLFDLSPTTTRLPSALSGTLAILGIYLIAKKLFDTNTAIFSALLLAISPWHLQFSRAAFEATISFTIIIFGILFMLYGQKNKFWAYISIPILFASAYFYLAARLISPLILFTFFWIFQKEIKKNLRVYIYGLIIAIVIVIPIISTSLSSSGQKHIKEVSIFEDKSIPASYVEASAKNQTILSRIFLNRRIPYIFESFHKYSLHFSPGFLFFGDDPNARHRSAFHGNLYLFEIILLIIGFSVLAKYKDSKSKYFILALVLIAPLPAAFSQEAPHSLRTLPMLLPLSIVSALGAKHLWENLKVKIIMPFIIVIFFINYLLGYYIVYPLRDSSAWGYGYQQLFTYLSQIDNNYDRIVVTAYYWKPYIYYLYVNKIDPRIFQNNPDVQSIGKYRFGTTFWDSGGVDFDEESIDKLKGNKTLLVLSEKEFEKLKGSKFKQIKTISDYSGRNGIFEVGEWL